MRETLERQALFDFNIPFKTNFVLCDLDNIKETLPELHLPQQEDVYKAELRFENGKGYLFTNGTGSGKTFVGLGIIKRFILQDKMNVLIVVPTAKKSEDWISEGLILNLDIYMCQGISDSGHGISVTTYANFYQNDALERKEWDLIMYDESHYLNQNAQGKETSYLEKHKSIANLPSGARKKIHKEMRSYPTYNIEDPSFEPDKFYKESDLWNSEFDFKLKERVERTKIIFLSATPFAYHKSIKYADGSLFDIEESLMKKELGGGGYNIASGFDLFMCEHFGYQMKYNRLTIPDVGVDQNLLERNFFENFREKGVISTRVLDLPFDYSREFITVSDDLGDVINKGMELFYGEEMSKDYKYLSMVAGKKWNFIYINQLLESIKARQIIPRIKQHLELGRKVVIFHSYNNAIISHPFHFDAEALTNKEQKYMIYPLEKEIKRFNEEFSEYVNLDLSGLLNTRDTIQNAFPNMKQFNGKIPKKKRGSYIEDFNIDYSFTNTLLVQSKAGREGISLHDRSGEQQRVLMTLGLPTAPTEAIQGEGRIYRVNLMSNAIYEYITLQTNFERFAFATKIAERSKTAENLAMGNLARDLETAFKEGYINSHSEPPCLEQGFGGKEKDRVVQTITLFDRAKTFYWSKQKKNSITKSKDGSDAFFTPEPLGLKMVEWCNHTNNDVFLEPSAGIGSIGRWFPGETKNIFVEPNFNLASELAINAKGEVKIMTFEDFKIWNKANYILMNPPFGTGGKLAMEHIIKATLHMKMTKSVLYAIIPNGSSMQRRLDMLYKDEKAFNRLALKGELILPPCTFERQGTNVSCKIIKLIRLPKDYPRDKIEYERIDLSHIGDINTFFDEIETLNF